MKGLLVNPQIRKEIHIFNSLHLSLVTLSLETCWVALGKIRYGGEKGLSYEGFVKFWKIIASPSLNGHSIYIFLFEAYCTP